MTGAIDTITEAIPCNIVYGRRQAAEGIARALTAAGFVILSRSKVEAIREALEPFAKAGELFPDDAHEFSFDQCIYRPAAGDEYALTGGHLRDARKAIRKLKSGGE